MFSDFLLLSFCFSRSFSLFFHLLVFAETLDTLRETFGESKDPPELRKRAAFGAVRGGVIEAKTETREKAKGPIADRHRLSRETQFYLLEMLCQLSWKEALAVACDRGLAGEEALELSEELAMRLIEDNLIYCLESNASSER